ncbi:MAG: GAF domain-containing protein [Chloroflexota bacterium]
MFQKTVLFLGGFALVIGTIVLTMASQQWIELNEAGVTGFVLLVFFLICTALHFAADFMSYRLRAGILLASLLTFSGYLLFVNWLISGVLLLLLSVFLSSIYFNLKGSVFVLIATQAIVASRFAWDLFRSAQSDEIVSNAITPVANASPIIQATVLLMIFFGIGIIALSATQTALQKQKDLRKMITERRVSLENEVQDNTRILNVTREVNRLISTILDSNRLVGDVIDKIKQAFDYYHVQIYLYHPDDEVLKIAGATGETGTALMIGHHQLEMSEGLVGRAASTGHPVIVSDVKQAEDWVPNSLLPDTVAEIAVPIIWENKVLGVLDVQHNKPFDPRQNDISILQTVALQLGTALSNVKTFQLAQANLKRESILNDMALKLQIAPDVQSSMQIAGKNLYQLIDPVSVKVSLETEHLMEEQTG